LFAVAQTFVNILRHNDIVVRRGGEEFLLITFIRENKMINTIGNKIVKIIQSTFIELENQIIRFTVSGGGTLLREEDILNAINRADKLMYKAKKECKSLFISDVSYI
jgi:diguanylate cyclase (GGDEF)-like protein